MSDDTRANLEDSISAHIADAFPGDYTSGWVVVVASSSLERPDATNYRLVSPDGQPFHVDDGLINVGRKIIRDAWDEDGDDDD